ncbi:MAG TPA: GNAT family N-acetyltransferase [Microthrixaceae bacterium]|nr:GNAT family N-acetyltransferase [Microthrixaceae bacterium]
MRVRLGLDGEAPGIRDLETAADKRFLAIGMDSVASREPPSLGFLELAISEERLWIAEVDDNEQAGYAVAVFVDESPHLQVVAVHPSHQGRGIGRALVNEVAEWARRRAADRLTITTFRDVSWNRPLYERLGFEVIDDSELSPGLRAIRDEEISIGLDDEGPRVTMFLKLNA